MSKIPFKVMLLSDIIISDSPATEGRHQTLDFIPGSCFLGIAAQTFYTPDSDRELAFLLLHSGKVRFGDAHPGLSGTRSLHIPACLYKAKYYEELGVTDDVCFVNYKVDHDNEKVKAAQLKQCRNGFYVFGKDEALEVKIEKSFAIKSAYDPTSRRAKDEQMFGYESMGKGSIFFFNVEIDKDVEPYREDLVRSISGIRHIGRSRSAQYGRVKIEECTFRDYDEHFIDPDYTVVYADARLIFFDKNGIPTLTPTAEQLGLPGGTVVWKDCQIRTFQYAPWNYQRQAYDNEHIGIEKGSVFIVRDVATEQRAANIGVYLNEGFGRVIYNPAFTKTSADGSCRLMFRKAGTLGAPTAATSYESWQKSNNTLMGFLESKKRSKAKEKRVYDLVKDFMDNNAKLYNGISPSQWGTIRGIAMAASHMESSKLIEKIEEFTNHGVSKEKWDDRERRSTLVKHLKNAAEKGVSLHELVVNLCSQMAKRKEKLQDNG